MAEAASAGATRLHRGLPEEIFIWEILVRLPPQSPPPLPRRLPHLAQRNLHPRLPPRPPRPPALAPPSLRLQLCRRRREVSIDIIPFDHRAGLTAADQLQSVARLRYPNDTPDRKASCDGLLIVSFDDMHFTVCNPATRQYAHLQQLDGFRLLGIYRHNPTGDYRVLLYGRPRLMGGGLGHAAQNGSYVFTLGSGNPPRHIGYPNAEELVRTPESVLFHGNLHWHIGRRLMVFDTTTESFRQMPAPPACDSTVLFEMGDMLCMSRFSEEETVIDICMLQDYEAEVWAYKCRVKLPVAELREQIEKFDVPWNVQATSLDGDVLLLVKFADWLFHVDINGMLVASFRRRGLCATQLQIKQTLVSHTFFPTQEGYVVDASPFI